MSRLNKKILKAKEKGLYSGREHDACGVGFIAHIKNEASHDIIKKGLEILVNLTHRGAVGADPLMGDGAGLLTQLPHQMLAEEMASQGISLPEPGDYGVGQFFLPQDNALMQTCQDLIEEKIEAEGHQLIGWRDVPVNNDGLSKIVIESEPVHKQVFIARNMDIASEADFERQLYTLRKVISNTIFDQTESRDKGFYVVSMSCRTIVYKGMFLANQLGPYFKDLIDERYVSALALVHQRFSTNTFPSWKLAHPYRMVAHNGEINTIRGNTGWMAARQASVSSDLFGDSIEKHWPISYEGQSDTACFDNALEFLIRGGYSLPHAAMMLVPEAWAGNPLMDEKRRDFYAYHAALMEPWDGPAALTFTDGLQIGATLDRNGLRPARYIVTKNDLVVMASEAGVLSIPEEDIIEKWRLQPGKMLLIDLIKGKIISDQEIKEELANRHPYRTWLEQSQIVLEDVPASSRQNQESKLDQLTAQKAFGYTQEDIKHLMAPMASTGQEAIGSMGTDTPLSILSDKPKLLYTYFKQNFAQVTNPPIDPIREEAVMSLVSFIGPRPNILDLKGSSKRKRLKVRQPILSNQDLNKIIDMGEEPANQFSARVLDMVWPRNTGPEGMEQVLDELCHAAEQAIKDGHNIIILSDKAMDKDHVAIPALLATAAVHHDLIRKGLRTSVGLVVETGEAREVHHFCALAGYGAEAINPYLAFDTFKSMAHTLPEEITPEEVVNRYIKAIDKGILKVMSKMGISTYQSYCGAQIFDAIGLSSGFVEKYFFGTATTIEGADILTIAKETYKRHGLAFGNDENLRDNLEVGGEYAYRVRGEAHSWSPNAIAHLQHAVRQDDRQGKTAQEKYALFKQEVNVQNEHLLTIRGLFRIKSAEEIGNKSIPLEDVEPAAELVKRFSTGAMSFGSISKEAHTTLARAMNAIGGKSNTGEGGEVSERYKPLTSGQMNPERSAIKQVASGRFGVTTEYLVNSDVIQIKVAQGAKPGEGGQLPGHKVNAVIANTRHSTPGVGLISPPPHHDIYSIEDLAQLIYDLKNVQPKADISVKLVSEVGVGTVAAGVAKARADHITISGFDGGTGASPLTSLKHAGSVWEIGLAETHQTLVLNGLRSRVALQVDGGLKTGRDVIIGALLGADEFGFSTAPLIAVGCLMMRKCHLNTCPVGIATQDPVLRQRFKGTPEHVINYFFLIAEEIRGMMAEMGIARFEDLVGRSDWLDERDVIDHWKAKDVDFSRLFHYIAPEDGDTLYHSQTQNHHLEDVLDRKLIEQAAPALNERTAVRIESDIASLNRSAGAMLSGEVAQRYGHKGLPEDTITVNFKGIAGQSFGAFLTQGITFDLEGAGNDYVGKGLSGGRIVIRPSEVSQADPGRSIIVGNTVLYGAIGGEAYFRGVAGERFAVRNSGAITVVEGTGDHGCEYMTGGVVVVIGQTGRNFAAGMSGGVAYVLDEDGSFTKRCNMSMVEIEPVPEEDDLLERLHHHGGDIEWHGRVDVQSDMTRHDSERLQQLLNNHLHYTNSAKAKAMLDNWEVYRTKFVKVMPIEYRRALTEMQEVRMAQRAASGVGVEIASEAKK